MDSVILDVLVKSKDYMGEQIDRCSNGGFVGLAAVDYSDYGSLVTFSSFDGRKLGEQS